MNGLVALSLRNHLLHGVDYHGGMLKLDIVPAPRDHDQVALRAQCH